MRIYVFLFFTILFASCQQNKSDVLDVETKDSVVVLNKKNINSIGVVLTPEAHEFTKDWVEYQQFDSFIMRFYAISNSEALQNSKDLSKMATQLKDSIRFTILQSQAVATRFNILESECKRLADMSSITAIKATEVSQQIKNILEAYSAVNAKLNSVLDIENLESELQLDPDFMSILNQVPEEENSIPDSKNNNTNLSNSKTTNQALKANPKFLNQSQLDERKKRLKEKISKKSELEPE